MKMGTPGFRWWLALSLLVAAGGLRPDAVRGETRMAASLTPEAVWDAINAAKDGDVVQLPAGNGGVDEGMERRPLGQDEGHHHPGRRN